MCVGVSARGVDAVSATVLHPLDSPTLEWGFLDCQLGLLAFVRPFVTVKNKSLAPCLMGANGGSKESRILQVI